MSLIGNERTKLLAAALNNTAVATLVTAVIGPIVTFFYGAPSFTQPWWVLFWLLWLLVAMALHLFAQAVLGRLEE